MKPQAQSCSRSLASPLRGAPARCSHLSCLQLVGKVQSRQKNRLSGIPVVIQ